LTNKILWWYKEPKKSINWT